MTSYKMVQYTIDHALMSYFVSYFSYLWLDLQECPSMATNMAIPKNYSPHLTQMDISVVLILAMKTINYYTFGISKRSTGSHMLFVYHLALKILLPLLSTAGLHHM